MINYVIYSLPIAWKYVQFAMYMLLPPVLLILYRMRFDKDTWLLNYVEKWDKTQKRWKLQITIWFILSGLIGVLIQQQSANGFKKPNALAIVVAVSMMTLGVLVYKLAQANARKFARSYDKPGWWYKYLKHKKRTALFILNVLYMPLGTV